MGSCAGKEVDPEEIKLIAAKRMSEDNKLLVRRFIEEVIAAKNLGPIDQYISETKYIQHSPMAGDGRDALRAGLDTWFKSEEVFKYEILRIGADNDLVFVHSRMTCGEKISSVANIFRVENGLIVEHWDTIQAVPEESANTHPMF